MSSYGGLKANYTPVEKKGDRFVIFFMDGSIYYNIHEANDNVSFTDELIWRKRARLHVAHGKQIEAVN